MRRTRKTGCGSSWRSCGTGSRNFRARPDTRYSGALSDEPRALGARSLNIELQNALNPPGEVRIEGFGWTFCPGDKVMQVENDYDKDVYNGDLGVIFSCSTSSTSMAKPSGRGSFQSGRNASANCCLMRALRFNSGIIRSGAASPFMSMPVA